MDSDSSNDQFDIKKLKEINKKQNQCLVCGKIISDRRNLVRHLRKIHAIEPAVRKPQLKCSFNDDCTFICATSERLIEHLKEAHELHIEKKTFKFKCRKDFEKWKQEEELSTNARYVSYTGSKARGSKKFYYLKCHRSGVIRSGTRTSGRKRSKPAKGYTQCGTTCPSSIKVVENPDASLHVMYYPVHLGHSLDDRSIQYMKLSVKEKEEIFGKLANGEPVGKIVSDARKQKGAKLSRINILQRRDVYNLKKNINFLEKEEDYDGKMIDEWVKNLNLQPLTNNPVILYTPMDEAKDYILILIHPIQKIIFSVVFDDSIVYIKTKKGKANIDFNLTTVSIISENGDSYPIAFCISHKTEYITLYTLFKIVYQCFGLIKAQIFVSDNNSQYYLAWKNVMGECENKLICIFDLESYWEQKLLALKCPIIKQKSTSDQLRNILYETDKNVFESELVSALNSWEADEELKLFSNFFQKVFVKKHFEWATCYRIHSTRKESINQYLEPINSTLDKIYVESYSNLHSSLNQLLCFVRDTCMLKLLNWDEQVLIEKLRETKDKHSEGLSIKSVRFTGSDWIVTDDGSDYVVLKNDNNCNKECGILCAVCNICVHNYSCGCNDYVTGFNICRHLHAVRLSCGDHSAQDTKDFVAMTLRRTAVEITKSLTKNLEKSYLTSEKYSQVIAKLSNLNEEIMNT